MSAGQRKRVKRNNISTTQRIDCLLSWIRSQPKKEPKQAPVLVAPDFKGKI